MYEAVSESDRTYCIGDERGFLTMTPVLSSRLLLSVYMSNFHQQEGKGKINSSVFIVKQIIDVFLIKQSFECSEGLISAAERPLSCSV